MYATQRSCQALLVFAFFLTFLQNVSAQQVPDEWRGPVERTTTFVFENDIFTGQDSGYTNGVALLFSKGTFPAFTPDVVPRLIAKVVKNSWIGKPDRRQRGLVYTLAHSMQTPEDISVETLQLDQPPYAGLLFGGLSLYAFDQRIVDQLSFSLGVVGPWSFAEQAQSLIHTITDSDEPAGWDNQLNNEIVFQIEASRGYRFASYRSDSTPEVDLIGLGSVAAGTLASYGSASIIARFGEGLAVTFPVASFLPNRQINANVFASKRSWYGFVSAELQYVVNDIQIDGNTFVDSHSVPLEHT
ncbi:MAG: lipid A deacylase LpxR family protein, partial [Granulosicoccus sp.]